MHGGVHVRSQFAQLQRSATQNFGIDERAEVGLITRSIKLTATTPPAPNPSDEPLKPSPSLHWGGEIRIGGDEATTPQVAIVGVELEKFGKDQLGSYPIHLHMLGKAKNAPKIMANSIHHSFNKCITVHMTSDVTIEDNVCARVVGHMFYEEHGAEENISFRRNLGLGAMSNSFDVYKVTTVGPSTRQISRQDLIRDHWWTGDNLAKGDYNYDGFNIPNTDEQKNPTHGSCQRPDGNGGFGLSQQPYSPAHPTECKPGEIYTEPASGFWITNPEHRADRQRHRRLPGRRTRLLVGDATQPGHGERGVAGSEIQAVGSILR